MKKINWDYEKIEGRWSIEKIHKLRDLIKDIIEDENPSKIEIIIDEKYESIIGIFIEEFKQIKIKFKENIGNDIKIYKKLCDVKIVNLPCERN